MKKIIIIIIILFVCFSNSGCMSIMSRVSPDPFCSDIPEGAYRTFRCDLNQFKCIPVNSEGSVLKGSLLFIIGIIETPVAFLLDTIFLPYDLLRLNKGRKVQEKKSGKPAESNITNETFLGNDSEKFNN